MPLPLRKWRIQTFCSTTHRFRKSTYTPT